MANTFGKKLAEIRLAKGVTQAELAERTGVPIGTIRYHEYDLHAISAEDLFRYVKALGVSAAIFQDCKSAKSVRRPKNK